MGYFLQGLNAVSSPGAGPALALDQPRSIAASVQVVTTGSPAGLEIHVEVSLDGANWFNLLTIGGASYPYPSGEMFGVPGSVILFLRLNLISLSGGSSPTVTANVGVITQDDVP